MAAIAGIMLLTVASIQRGWLPPEGQAVMVRDLADRLKRVDVGIKEDKLIPAAEVGVRLIIERLERLGETRVLALAPRFARLDVPPARQPHLDAMGRLGLCTYYLEDAIRTPRGDVDARLDAAMGPPALTIAIVYLRAHYLSQGGSDAAIKGYLGGTPLNDVGAQVQQDRGLLQYTAGECGPAVSALLDD